MSPLPLAFDDRGLIPVIVQDRLTGEIRMFAFATEQAVRATLQTGRATFWSRSRGELWEKGRTSGNEIQVERVLVDCDSDCLVYSGEPRGNSCHTGAADCFFQVLTKAEGGEAEELQQATGRQTILAELEAVLESRKAATAGASYTKSLYDKGGRAIGAKIREEAGELAQAIEDESDGRVVSEAADTLYHVLVGLRARSIPLREVFSELARRAGTSGHAEKASRSR